MKDKMIVIMIYTLTFVAVTAGIIYLNQKYENIFKFDFSPAKTHLSIDLKKPEYKTALAKYEKDFRKKLIDSLLSAHSLNQSDEKFVDQSPILRDSLQRVKAKLKTVLNAQKQDSMQAAQMRLATNKKDYDDWLKKTAALYNSMESAQAAKIIKKYSDNVARDIIYKLKKQKAAEILAMLNPDEATRITKVVK